MGLKDTKYGKLLYHLTRLSNLKSIIQHGLAPRRMLVDANVLFDDVADSEIMNVSKMNKAQMKLKL